MSEQPDEWEQAWIAQRQEEDRAERERLAAQRSRADLTPMEPAPGVWVVESHWKPLYDGDIYPVRQPAADLDAAHRAGGYAACCEGLRRVRVIGPDGRIHYSYDREGRFYLAHSPEAIGRDDAAMARIHAEMGLPPVARPPVSGQTGDPK